MKAWMLIVPFACGITLAGAAELDVRNATKACMGFNQSGAAGTLDKLKDPELERALCLAAKVSVEAIATKNAYLESLCVESTEHLMREFKKRWPKRDAKEVTKGC